MSSILSSRCFVHQRVVMHPMTVAWLPCTRQPWLASTGSTENKQWQYWSKGQLRSIPALLAGGLICVLWFGARLVVQGKLSPGELSTFVIYAVYVGSNVGAIAGIVSSLVQVGYPMLSTFMLWRRMRPYVHLRCCLRPYVRRRHQI